MRQFTVLIVGAGLGGLLLAQSLRRANIAVQIFERDRGPWDRPQGYRLHIDGDGAGALGAALPPELYRLFEATSMQPVASTTIVDSGFVEQRRVVDEAQPRRNVDRATLRQILLTGLDDVVCYGEKLARYELSDAGVTAFFESGRVARGDVLVGADGIRSVVRAQRLPDAEIQDTGVRAIYSRIPIEAARRLLPAQVLEDVFTVAVDGAKRFLGLGPVVFPTRPDAASSALFPKAQLRALDDYVICIVGGRHELFGHDDATLRGFSSSDLRALAQHFLAEWPAAPRAVIAANDPSSFFFVEMFTSVPLAIPPSSAVTLLGDAAHAMTPTLGRGANLAMRDAALLGRALDLVFRGQISQAQALADYEAEMAAYGFDVVRQSAAMGARLMGQNPLP